VTLADVIGGRILGRASTPHSAEDAAAGQRRAAAQ
jgi:hypothetical protein